MAANEVQFGGVSGDRVFLDTDLTKPFHVKNQDADPTLATAKDVTGFAITFDVRKEDKSSTVLLTKAVGSGIAITGTFNSVAASNTQRVTLTLADTDLTTTIFGRSGGKFRYSLKRTDAGLETILAWGKFVVERATQA